MPKKKTASFGLFKITEHKTKMIELGNGVNLKLQEGHISGRIANIIVDIDGRETKLSASDIVQFAEAIRAVDRSKRFVCGFHGSFETTNRRQPAACPACESAKIQMHSGAIENNEVQLEEDDA